LSNPFKTKQVTKLCRESGAVEGPCGEERRGKQNGDKPLHHLGGTMS